MCRWSCGGICYEGNVEGLIVGLTQAETLKPGLLAEGSLAAMRR